MTVNIGIVGAGGMADYHIEGFRKEGASIIGVADPNTEAAQALSAKQGIDNTFSSLAEMLTNLPDLDAVSIITPNKFHHSCALEALEGGKHVYCEKPPALNAAETEEMKQAAEKTGKTLMFDFNNRARPESFAMMELIKDGTVGPINSAQALWIRRTGIPGFGGWFTTKELAGGGPVIDLLHMIDLALHFMGYPEPEWVLGQTFDDFINDNSFKGPWGIPDVEGGVTDVEAAAHGFVRFKTGQILILRNSWAEMNKQEEVSVTFQGKKAGGQVKRLFGTDGLDETSIDSCELYIQENGCSVNREVVTEKDETMGRVGAAQNFVRTVKGEDEPLSTPQEAVKLMKIIDAVYESAGTGKPVQVG
ncbi:Gfo/Idh/MocA family protein [Planctomycetota bacterium]